ncbi:MAG: bifunctional folylpolyglutamate synthase/dihydrofolate synthase [Deltaproteobacteria bacterium]|nr:bifunctional folylpolyglutamate synthase/dihydrofolate synthase [Deltaproteobacteria bacterium]
MTRSDASGPVTSLGEAEAWLESLINVERRSDVPYERLGLEPIRALLARVGDPQGGLSVVHLAGSKGKGSTALLVEALLRECGERVGTFTSPHLESWTERFRIDGQSVAPPRLVAAIEALRPHVEALRAGPPELLPSWFDVTAAAAFWIFRDAGVDRAVVEVGLGGRLDSTNVIQPAVTAITTLELEHTRFLGDTLTAIAGEKAGILKPGCPGVVGDLAPEAAAVVEARAKDVGAPLAWLGRDFHVDVLRADAAGLELRLRDGGLDVNVHMPLLGAHHAANAALALACVNRLPGLSGSVPSDAVRRGLAAARLPGRVERVADDPPVIVDFAHTQASAQALADALASFPERKCRLVLSVSADKDLAAILAPLLPGATEVTVTRAEPTRSLDPLEVAAVVRELAPDIELRAIPNPFLALRSARDRQEPDEILCVTGSVYLAGIARRVFAP